MKTKKLLFLIALIFVIVGCGPTGRWVNPSVTQEQANRDQYECRSNAELVCHYWDPRVGVIPGAICVANHYGQCVQSRGYSWQKNER